MEGTGEGQQAGGDNPVKITKCWKCKTADIWFGETEAGKKMPVNAWSTPRGKIVPIDPEADVPMLQFLKKDEEPPPGARRYSAHFGTCRPKTKPTERVHR